MLPLVPTVLFRFLINLVSFYKDLGGIGVLIGLQMREYGYTLPLFVRQLRLMYFKAF